MSSIALMFELMMSPRRENRPMLVSFRIRGGGSEEETAEEDADGKEHPGLCGARRQPPAKTACVRSGLLAGVTVFHFEFVLLGFRATPVALSPSLISRTVPDQNYVITSYSIHYTKLYDHERGHIRLPCSTVPSHEKGVE